MHLFVPKNQLRYRAMIGTGGIGAGQFFAVTGNNALSREESRGGRLLNRRDYCKLHIIAHYVSSLLASGFATIAIGKVGNDPIGRDLLGEMNDAGIDVRHVGISKTAPTLFSFCIVYPDGTGGNLTTEDSASSCVNRRLIAKSEDDFRRYSGVGIALAVPEVPLEARVTLIQMGSRYGFLRIASFTSSEVSEAIAKGLVRQLDVIALNRDEAVAAAGIEAEGTSLEKIAKCVVDKLRSENPDLRVSITAGKSGSYIWDGCDLRHVPAVSLRAQCTAGAGDAHLAGIIISMAAGLEFAEACRFGTLLAALSVTSPHTIHPSIDRAALADFARRKRFPLTDGIRRMLAMKRK